MEFNYNKILQNALIPVFIMISFMASGQQCSINGDILDTEGKPLPYATVVLLNPTDSTVLYFCITSTQGGFELHKVRPGDFLLQVAIIGYQTYYRKITLPLADGENLGSLIMKPVSYSLGEAQVTAERIPILIKKDTVEYNADAFKTKPDAVAEDLLKKLPGIEVDRAGNIKAMGEDVNRVLVDGKEFFSTDPKVATKNLPAESVKKVQVYDKKTDEAELLGINDSEYDKTINFVLKDNAKKAYFGDASAGGGTDTRYQGNAKVYRFTDKRQFAVLGMLNNVNRPGFSFQDYIDFNGGIRSMLSSDGGNMITGDAGHNLPIDFGKPITGKLTSGAGGINYSYEFAKNNRFNISYMGSGSQKEESSTSYTRNFTNNSMFEQNSTENGNGSDANHLFNVGWRNKASSTQHFMLNGVVTLAGSKARSDAFTQSLADNIQVNSLDNYTNDRSNQLNTLAEGSWLRKGSGNWKMLKINGSIRYNQSLKEIDWRNISQLPGNPVPDEDAQYRNTNNRLLQYTGIVGALRKIGTGYYIEPSLTSGFTGEQLEREQGINSPSNIEIDSVSPLLQREYKWLKPALVLRKYTKKTKLRLGAGYELGQQINRLNKADQVNLTVSSILPQFMWDYEYKTGRRISAYYTTSTSLPTATQLLPLISNSNPFAVYYGNRNLEAEYRNNLYLTWFLFDQFSFTSLFANISGNYTRNKINQSISIADDLRQAIALINVPDDYTASANVSFSTPIRLLGIKTGIDVQEKWNRGISYVNSVKNINTNITHKFGLKFDNRKKDRWDLEVGGYVSFTDARYSIQKQLNRLYKNYSAYGEVRYTPSDHWHFRLNTDVTRYDSQSFGNAETIPLLGAEINYYFMPNKRAMISIEGYDLLNRNTGLSRESTLNYLREVHSETIGRYIMLSFRYKLNKSGGENGGFKVDVRR